MDILEHAQQALESNNFSCHICRTKEDAKKLVLERINAGSTIGVGGSMTLEKDLDLFPDLEKKGTFLNQYREGLTPEQSLGLRKQSMWADYFLTSANAITLEGELVNTDGTGNRVAAIVLQYGPKKILVVAGRNKIVKDRAAAFERIRNTAAPLNVKRLGRQTGCDQTGYCIDCKTPNRICTNTVVTQWQPDKNRITIVLVDADLGY